MRAKRKAALSARPRQQGATPESLAPARSDDPLLGLLAVAPERPPAGARVRFLRACASLRRAEQALYRPFVIAASLLIDTALVALEAAQAELQAFDEEASDEEGSS